MTREVIVIVGPDATKLTDNEARDVAQTAALIFKSYDIDSIEYLSGGASGVDEISDEVATGLGVKKHAEHPCRPAKGHEHWPKKGACSLGEKCFGFKARNLKMVELGTIFYCLVPMREKPKEPCYHCNTMNHQVNGGCWTLLQAKRQGKETRTLLIGLR